MSNPAAQPRRVFLALLVLAVLMALVGLLAAKLLLLAAAVGLLGLGLLVLAARPSGARHS